MRRSISIWLTIMMFVSFDAHAQQPSRIGGIYLSSTGLPSGPWNPFMAAGGSAPSPITPQSMGIYYTVSGLPAGPWYPCTLAICFHGGGAAGPWLPLAGGTLAGPVTIPTGASVDVTETGAGLYGTNNANGFFTTSKANDGSTATVLNMTACLSATGTARECIANATNKVLGITVATAGTTGYPKIATDGESVTVTYDATPTVGHWAVTSATPGQLVDSGATTPPICGNEIVGLVDSATTVLIQRMPLMACLTGVRYANNTAADSAATSAQVQTVIGASVYDAYGATSGAITPSSVTTPQIIVNGTNLVVPAVINGGAAVTGDDSSYRTGLQLAHTYAGPYWGLNVTNNATTGAGTQAGNEFSVYNGTSVVPCGWVGVTANSFTVAPYAQATFLENFCSGGVRILSDDPVNGLIAFYTGGYTSDTFRRMTITPTGNVGIGTLTPSQRFAVGNYFTVSTAGQVYGSGLATDQIGTAQLPSTMTSNSAPSPYVVSASSEYSSTYAAWKAFDNSAATFWNNLSGTTGWLKVDLGSTSRISQYAMQALPQTPPTNTPHTWTFEGSGTGTFTGEQVVLDTETSVPDWVAGEIRTYILATPANYRYYRLNVTAVGGGGAYVTLASLVLSNFYSNFSADSSGNVIHRGSVSNGITTATNSDNRGTIALVAGTGSYTFTQGPGAAGIWTTAPICVINDDTTLANIATSTKTVTNTALTITGSVGTTDTYSYICSPGN